MCKVGCGGCLGPSTETGREPGPWRSPSCRINLQPLPSAGFTASRVPAPVRGLPVVSCAPDVAAQETQKGADPPSPAPVATGDAPQGGLGGAELLGRLREPSLLHPCSTPLSNLGPGVHAHPAGLHTCWLPPLMLRPAARSRRAGRNPPWLCSVLLLLPLPEKGFDVFHFLKFTDICLS